MIQCPICKTGYRVSSPDLMAAHLWLHVVLDKGVVRLFLSGSYGKGQKY